MENIPIFHGIQTEDQLTCGQFLAKIEDYAKCENLTEPQLKELCQKKISDQALQSIPNDEFSELSWVQQKKLMLKTFSVKLSIKEKVDIRKNLQQFDTESAEDFYDRCVQAQYLVSDDVRDVAFDREVLLHFLIGLAPFIQDLVLSSQCSNIQEYIKEAKKYLQSVKEEPVEGRSEVKVESDTLYFDPANEEENDNDVDSVNNYNYDQESHHLPHEIDTKDEKHKNNINNKSHSKRSMNKLICDFCHTTFQRKHLLKKHLEQLHHHHPHKNGDDDSNANNTALKIIKWKKCRHCDEKFRSVNGRFEHEKEIHGDLKNKSKCDQCAEEYPDIRQLALHVTKSHCLVNNDGKTVCLYCTSFQRERIYQVRNHILATHFNQPDHECKLCNKVFIEQFSLNSHMKNVHLKERSYQCDKCTKSFQTKNGLQMHIVVYHDEPKDLQCSHCDKKFTNEVYLDNHVKLNHTGKKNIWVCSECGISFNVKHNFQMHCLTQHTNAEEQEKLKISCPDPDCKYTALHKIFIERHYRRIHGKMKSHQCQHCSKSFFAKNRLVEHVNGVHLGLKPFKCDQCSYSTAYNTTLHEHKKVNHGTRKYQCPYCPHFCKYKGNLDKHINNIHKKMIEHMQTN